MKDKQKKLKRLSQIVCLFTCSSYFAMGEGVVAVRQSVSSAAQPLLNKLRRCAPALSLTTKRAPSSGGQLCLC